MLSIGPNNSFKRKLIRKSIIFPISKKTNFLFIVNGEIFIFFSFPQARENEVGRWKQSGWGDFSTLQDSKSRNK